MKNIKTFNQLFENNGGSPVVTFDGYECDIEFGHYNNGNVAKPMPRRHPAGH